MRGETIIRQVRCWSSVRWHGLLVACIIEGYNASEMEEKSVVDMFREDIPSKTSVMRGRLLALPIAFCAVGCTVLVAGGCGGGKKADRDAGDMVNPDVVDTVEIADDSVTDPGHETNMDSPLDGDGGLVICGYESDGACPPADFTAAATCVAETGGCVCTLSGTYTENLTLTPDVTWMLSGQVVVGDEEAGDGHAATITILPGTTIMGEKATNGLLAIARNSRIVADGNEECPIVFTSDQPEGSRTRGDWGGVWIKGNAPHNLCFAGPCLGIEPGGDYGGSASDDDSGTLRYVRIEFAGHAGTLYNYYGLILVAVGAGTIIEQVQIHMAGEDAIKFEGGTVDFRKVLATGAAGDGLDWNYGWVGRGQFFVSQQYEDGGSQGMEGDSTTVPGLMPRSHPVLSNLTLIGTHEPDPGHTRLAIALGEGTAGNISCAVVMGSDHGLDIDDEDTYSNAWDTGAGDLSGELTFEYSTLSCDIPYMDDGEPSPPFTLEEFFETLNAGNALVDPTTEILSSPSDVAAPDYRPAPGGPAASGCTTPDSTFFESVTYQGGVDPTDDWTLGWTTHAVN